MEGNPLGLAASDFGPTHRPVGQGVAARRRPDADGRNGRPVIGPPSIPVPTGDPSRPRPGVESRVWDHDGPSLFANVYRLGPRACFTWTALLDAIDREL